jgi:hypothetical protein
MEGTIGLGIDCLSREPCVARPIPGESFFLDGNSNNGFLYQDVTVTGNAVPEPPICPLMVSAAVILI